MNEFKKITHYSTEFKLSLWITIVNVLSVISYGNRLCCDLIIDKWVISGIAFLVFIPQVYILFCLRKGDKGSVNISLKTLAPSFIICGGLVVIHSFFQMLGLIDTASDNSFRIVASFDNPAGLSAALTVSFPFILFCVNKFNNSKKRSTLLLSVIIIETIIVIATKSRAGLLSMGVVLFLFIIHNIEEKKKKTLLISVVIVFVISAILYFSLMKRGSNSGRGLILKVCLEMFKDAPVCGHGWYGFRSHYMLYQADYFDNCENHSYGILADNIIHPLNEYVKLTVNYGLIGFLTLIVVLVLIMKQYNKNKTEESFVGMMVLAGIGVLALFSYPFRYPLTLYALLYSILLIYGRVINRMSHRSITVIMSFVSILSIASLCFIFSWTKTQTEWKRLSKQFEVETDKRASLLYDYSAISGKLSRDPFFLYNYAYVLSKQNDYLKADSMAAESFRLMPNYDTALFLADNANYCGYKDKSEYYYKLASSMCPARFIPLFGLFKLYESNGQLEDMIEVGKTILAKPIKINSTEVRHIRMEVKRTLSFFL